MSTAWDAIGKFKPTTGNGEILDIGSPHFFALGAEWHAFVLRLGKEKGAFTETIHRANGLRLLDLAEKHERHATLSVKDGLWLYIEVDEHEDDEDYVMPIAKKPKKRRAA